MDGSPPSQIEYRPIRDLTPFELNALTHDDGGEGGDTDQIDAAGDVMVETGTQDIDILVVTAQTWTLTAPFEGLAALGPGGLMGIGNEPVNVLTGGAGDDSLSGLEGKDTLAGAGHDTLLGSTGDDTH